MGSATRKGYWNKEYYCTNPVQLNSTQLRNTEIFPAVAYEDVK